MACRGLEDLAALVGQAVKTIAADLFARQPAIGSKPRHRGTHHAAVDVQGLEEFQQRAEPYRTATRHDGITEYRDDDRAGARRLALELIDDAGQRMRHARGIARLVRARQWTGATLFSLAPFLRREAKNYRCGSG